MAYTGFKGISVKFGADTTELGKALKEIDNEARQTSKNLTEINKALKADPKNVQLMSDKYKNLSESIKLAKERLQTLKAAQKDIEDERKNGGKVDEAQWQAYQNEIYRTETRLKSLQKEVKNTSKALKEDLTNACNEAADHLKNGAKILAALETALLSFSAKSVKTGMEFDKAMSQVAATMGQTTDQIQELRDYAQEMGAKTAFSASDAASGLNILAQAGLTAQEQIASLNTVLDLSSAGALSLDTSASYLTGAVKGFGDSMENVTYYADLMAKGATLANTSVQGLGEAFSAGAATANSYGQSADSLTLSLLKLAEQNITGSEAATALNRAMQDVYTATGESKKALDELGVEAFDPATGKARDFNDIMDELSSSLSKYDEQQQIAYKNTIFSTYGMNAFNKMTVSTTETVNKFKDGLSNANGAAAQQAETQLDNLAGDITILKSEFEGLEIAVSDKLTPSLREAAKEGSKELENLIESVKNGELSETFEDLGEDISKFISDGIKTAAEHLPDIIKFLSAIIKHLEQIVKIAVTYKALSIGATTVRNISAIVSALGGLAKAALVAKDAQLQLNTAQKASIAGAGLGLALAAREFINYKTAALDAAGASNYLDSAQKELVSSVDNYSEKSEHLHRNLADNSEAIKAQGKVCSDTADEIYDLAKKEKLSASEKAKLLGKIQELNESVPDLNLTWDENTKSLSKNREEVSSLIDEYIRSEEAKAAAEELSKIKINLAMGEDDFNELEKQLKEAVSLVQNYEKEYDRLAEIARNNMGQEDWDGIGKKIEEARKKWEEQRDVVSRLSDSYREAKAARDKDTKSVEKLTSIVGKDTKTKKENTTAVKDNTDATEDAEKAYSTCRTELMELAKILKEVGDGQSYSTSQILDMIEKYPELAGHIQSTAEGYKIEAEAIKELVKARAENLKTLAEEKVQEAKAERTKTAKITFDKTAYKKYYNEYLKNGDNKIAAAVKASSKALKVEFDKAKDAAYKQALAYQKSVNQIANDIINGGYKEGSSASKSSSSSSSSKGSSSYSSSSKKSSSTSATDKIKARVESLLAANEHAYKIGKKSEEEYYSYIAKIDRKYYKGKKKYIEEHRALEEELYNYKKSIAEKNKQLRQQDLENEKKQAEKIKQAQAAEEKRQEQALAKQKSMIQEKLSYNKWQFDMDKKTEAQYYAYIQKIRDKYYKGNKNYITEYRELTLELYNYKKSLAEKEEEEAKQRAEEREQEEQDMFEQAKDRLETSYKNGKYTEIEYYNELLKINKAYYSGKKELAEEYAKIEAEINENIRKAQEDNINNILDLSEKTNDLIKAQKELSGAEQKNKIYYSAERGFYHDTDISAVTQAKENLYNAQKALAEKAISLNGNLTTAELSKILSHLPSFNGLNLPSTNSVSNKSVTNSFVFTGDIKTDNPQEFLKQLNAYVQQAGIDKMIGR